MTVPLEIAFETNIVTGDLQIDFHPRGDHTMPVGIREWPEIRTELRERVRARVESDRTWEAYLDSNRSGERLALDNGTVRIEEDGTIVSVDVRYEHPEELFNA